jgi:thymidylate kinase
MPIVNFEGADSVGKSSLIKLLINKYPTLKSIAFPTPEMKKRLLYIEAEFQNNLRHLYEYHTEFMVDFITEQENIYNLLKNETTTLLDRYFYSNATYLARDYFKYLIKEFGYTSEKPLYYFAKMMSVVVPFYYNLIQPDLVIYLYKPYAIAGTETGEIQASYEGCFRTLPPKDLVKIEGLQPDTFQKVESALKTRGYI